MTLDEIRGKHKGRSAVVMGAGPSLRHLDDRVYKHVTIAVNGSYLKAPKSMYYLTCDPAMTDHIHWPVLSKNKHTVALVPAPAFQRDWMRLNGFEDSRAVLYRRRKDVNDWNANVDGHTLIWGICSANTAVHAAVIMGCSPIYLVGLDCRCEDGKKYFWEWPDQPKDGTRDGYATTWLRSVQRDHAEQLRKDQYDAWFKKDGTPSGWTMRGWKLLRQVNPTLNIADASGGPLAHVFRPVSLQGILK